MTPNSLYLLFAWNTNDKQLVKEIFNILKKNNLIQKSIWLRKKKNSRGKSKFSHFKALAKKLFQNKSQIKDVLKKENAVTYYCTTVKNQVAWLKNGWKRAKKTLGVTGIRLSYEDDIYEGSSIIDK